MSDSIESANTPAKWENTRNMSAFVFKTCICCMRSVINSQKIDSTVDLIKETVLEPSDWQREWDRLVDDVETDYLAGNELVRDHRQDARRS
jgi:hypothetical protein